MLNKIIKIFFLLLIFIFFSLITRFYFSEKNTILTNKSRSSYAINEADLNNLPILENDTNNIIIYDNTLEDFKKKRKKSFWENLISNLND